MRDHFTSTEADAGRYERSHFDGYGDDGPTRGECDADERDLAAGSPRRAVPLIERVQGAIIWSGATKSSTWRRDVRRTAKGVCAFPLEASDDVARLVAHFASEGIEAMPADRGGRPFLFCREAQ